MVAWVKKVNFIELTITIFPTPIMICFWKVEGLDVQETLTEMVFRVLTQGLFPMMASVDFPITNTMMNISPTFIKEASIAISDISETGTTVTSSEIKKQGNADLTM